MTMGSQAALAIWALGSDDDSPALECVIHRLDGSVASWRRWTEPCSEDDLWWSQLPWVGLDLPTILEGALRFGMRPLGPALSLEAWCRVARVGLPEGRAPERRNLTEGWSRRLGETVALVAAVREALAGLPETTQADLRALFPREWPVWSISAPGAAAVSPLDVPLGEPGEGPEPLVRYVPPTPAEGWLGEDGPLAERLPEYRVRTSQQTMLEAVQRAQAEGGVAVIESPTGTGKSLAYLIPSMLRALSRGERVVISTHTVALQEQLLTNDVPLASHTLPVRTAVLKGRGRYLCLLKLDEMRGRLLANRLGLSSRERQVVAELVSFAATTQRGDIDAWSPDGAGLQVWPEVQADADACAGAHCPYAGSCFMRTAQRNARESHLVITNHALLLSGVLHPGVLPAFQHVVIDEAHHLADVATDAFAGEVELEAVGRWCGGHGDEYRRLLRPMAEDPELSAYAGAVERHAGAARLWTGQLAEQLRDPASTAGERQTTRLTPWLRDRLGLEPLVAGLGEALAQLSQAILEGMAAAELVYGAHRLEDAAWLRVQKWHKDIAQAAALLTDWAELDPDWVSWWETRTRAGAAHHVLHRTPLDVAGWLHEKVWSEVESAVLTSATLAVGDDFSFVRGRLGLTGNAVATLRLPDVLGWHDRAVLALPNDLATVHEQDFVPQVAGWLGPLATAVGGRTLILLTARNTLAALDRELRPRLRESGIELFAQGVDGPPGALVARFRRHRRAVLLGTASFWEGVDLPGDQLSLVVIGRLPFSPPGEPIDEARDERLRQSGQSPFRARALPEAVLRFRQGVGRLLRREEDRGVVVVLDHRAIPGRSPYASVFLKSLPGVPVWIDPSDRLLPRIAAFIDGDQGGTNG